MFRFNPGMDRVIFPKHHPYYNLSIQAKTVITDMADKREVKNGFAAKTIAEAEEAFRTQLGVKCRLDGFKKSDMAPGTGNICLRITPFYRFSGTSR